MTHTEAPAQAFDDDLCARVGMKELGEGWFSIPGTGWRIQDGTTFTSPWMYDHEEEGKEYGACESLTEALRAVLAAERDGMGDNPGYRLITIPAIQRIIDNEKEVRA